MTKSEEYLLNKYSKESIEDLYLVQNLSRKELKEKLQVKDWEVTFLIRHYGLWKGRSQALEVSKRHSMQRYGVEHPTQSKEFKERVKQTCLAKYGTSSYRNSQECRNRIKEACLERYGTDNVFKSKEFQEHAMELKRAKYGERLESCRKKALKTVQERYGEGVQNVSQIPEVKEKKRQTYLKKYGYDNPNKAPEVKEKKKQTCLERYGVASPIQFCIPDTTNSRPNKVFAKHLEDANLLFEREFPLGNKFYDFKIGKVLVEIDPAPTHNSTWGIIEGPAKDRQYHYSKTQLAYENNLYCIHVFDWDDPEEVIQQILSGKVPVTSGEPNKHWYNIKTGEHVPDNLKLVAEDMLKEGFVEIWDAGSVEWVDLDSQTT